MSEQLPHDNDRLRLHFVVLRCQAGDQLAFEQLFGMFGQQTARYLRGLVGDDADDVQQEVWLSVYRGISRLANPAVFRSWLLSTARHRAIDFLRARKREGELIEQVAIERANETHAVEPDDGNSLTVAELEAAFALLAAAHREVLVLRYQNDMSYSEIALVLGCSVGTVRSRLHYAKQRLHEAVTASDASRKLPLDEISNNE